MEREDSEMGEEGHQVQTSLLLYFAEGKGHWVLDQVGTSVTEQGSCGTAGDRCHALNHALRSGDSPAPTASVSAQCTAGPPLSRLRSKGHVIWAPGPVLLSLQQAVDQTDLTLNQTPAGCVIWGQEVSSLIREG